MTPITQLSVEMKSDDDKVSVHITPYVWDPNRSQGPEQFVLRAFTKSCLTITQAGHCCSNIAHNLNSSFAFLTFIVDGVKLF